MLPYSSNGAYGGSLYGRRKGFASSQNTVIGVLVLVAIASLGFSVFTHFRASSASAQRDAIKHELEGLRSELHGVKGHFSSRNAELEQLQLTYGHTQRRIAELTNQLQRKEAELRGVADQQRNGREAELTKMVEDHRQELLRSDNIIDTLETKVAKMEATHASREKDWHTLANKWIRYEQDLHDQYKKCTDEVAKLQNQTTTMNATAPLPEAEPTLRPDTDFAQFHTEIPLHKPHEFEPLPTPAPMPTLAQSNTADLPLPESKIRDSIVEMTGGKLGLEPGQQAAAGGAPDGDGHKAPEPTKIDHHHVYNDFHENEMGHNYDHYHGHYDSYDPMDEWWLHDAHGDWNADDQGHGHGHTNGDGAVHGQHHNEQHQQYQHQQQHQYDQREHPNQHDHHNQQQIHHYQEVHNGDWGGHAHPSPGSHHHQHPAMQGMEQHAQHAPSHWQQHDPQQQQQQQQQHHHQEQQQQQHHHQEQQQHHHHQQQQQQQHHYHQQHEQQHEQQYGDAHQHPKGDLAYKMGW